MTNLREFLEFDPAAKKGEKGYERAQRVVTFLRGSMQDMVDPIRAKLNLQFLYGTQSMDAIEAMFTDPKKAGIKFWTLAIMEKIKNILIAEEQNQGIHFELKAIDVMASNDRIRDQQLLANRGWIDAVMSSVNKDMGQPPYQMIKQKGLFKGNADEFDKMGLDSSNMQDINYFFQYHHRLLIEMVGEEPVNYFNKFNELSKLVPMMFSDIIANKAAAIRVNVNEMSGSVDEKYVAPQNIKVIRGKRNDFKDAQAIAYEQSMSVADFIKLLGNDFDYESDMNYLLQAVGSGNSSPYTGISSGDKLFYGINGNLCDYGYFLNYQVTVGYIEWKEIDATAHKFTPSNNKGRFGLYKIAVGHELSPNSIYTKDVRYCETTYKAYYLALGGNNQRLYKYGKLSYQETEGAEDEYSSFSIIARQEPGKSVVEIAMPWIEIIEAAVKKMDFMIRKAKPPGRLLNYESILDIGGVLYPNLKPFEQVERTLKLFTESTNELYTYPKVNGQPIGGGTQVNYDIPHGLSKAVMEFKQIYDWAYGNILNDIGISPQRSVYQPGERDNAGLQDAVTQYSEKATQYMHNMMVDIIENVGKRTLSFVQDIIQFKDMSTVPYKFLEKALGKATMDQLEGIGNTQLHRFGIFVHGLYLANDKNQQNAILMQSLEKGEISYEQYLLISQIESPKKALMVLAYEKLRKERAAVQAQQQAQQGQLQLQGQKHEQDMSLKRLEISGNNERENIRGFWIAQGQTIQVNGKLEEAKIAANNSADPQQIRQQIEAKQDAAAASADGGGQAPPAGPGPATAGPGGAQPAAPVEEATEAAA